MEGLIEYLELVVLGLFDGIMYSAKYLDTSVENLAVSAKRLGP